MRSQRRQATARKRVGRIPRRTQEQRRAETRRKLIDAAIQLDVHWQPAARPGPAFDIRKQRVLKDDLRLLKEATVQLIAKRGR